jgi:hypothetical protein
MDENFDSFLHFVKKGDLPAIRRLIDSGFDVNSPLIPLLWTNATPRSSAFF